MVEQEEKQMAVLAKYLPQQMGEDQVRELVKSVVSETSATSADLSVVKTVSPNPGQVGVPLSYRLAVTNNGPAAATNVTVNDPLPAGVAFVSSTPSQGACSGTTTVSAGMASV